MKSKSTPKSPLPREELTDVIDLALWCGQLLLQHGAEASRIEETVHHVGKGLGCDWMDILVSPNVVIVTTISGDEFRTKVRRVTHLGANFAVLDAINDVSHRVFNGDLDRVALRTELERISKADAHYNRWLVVGVVGLACAAFSRLFGADAPVVLVTLVASSVAMFIRQILTTRFFNMFLVVICVAFVAGIIASSAILLDVGARPRLALAASVLLLIPGVPLINAAEDLIQGHILLGVARGVTGGLISLSIALGLLLAMALTGVSGL